MTSSLSRNIRDIWLPVIMLTAGSIELAGASQAPAPTACEAPAKDTVAYFGALQFCLTFQRPPSTERMDEILAGQGLRRSAANASVWEMQDAMGRLEVRIVIEGRGIDSRLTLTPKEQISIAVPILEHFVKSARDVVPMRGGQAIEVHRDVETPHENCTATSAYLVSLDAKMLNSSYRLLCTK